nr:MAG TPA: hypothetical protein [Caudoviricetes sp.]
MYFSSRIVYPLNRIVPPGGSVEILAMVFLLVCGRNI